MTTRLPGLARRGPEVPKFEQVQEVPAVRHGEFGAMLPTVTTGMVDEAVESVVKRYGLASDLASVLMYNMGKDVSSGVAHAYYTSQATKRAAAVGVTRDTITVRYALSAADSTALVEYAPEYKIRFTDVEDHDHPVAAACRMIDHRLVMSRLPANATIADVGGSPLVHIRAGRERVHVCGPTVDVKDAMRHAMRRMEAGVIVETSQEPVVSGLARKYLSGDSSFVCGHEAHKCHHQVQAITAIHVYDIPIQQWPEIMVRKGASVVEGCMLFSEKFFDETVGQLGVSKVRYEIDVKEDTFSMGFSNSPSWWYRHSWSKFMLYGADQLLYDGTTAYSYKIVERRGDTIFFRILRLTGDVAKYPSTITRRTPAIPLVEVQGFELVDRGAGAVNTLKPRTYRFPRSLWYEMVSQASEDYERGQMDFTRMYNHYRTVSVRQTINAVLVMGGDAVSQSDLVPLVTHACLAAAAQSVLGQKTTRAITDSIMHRRGRGLESVFDKVQALVKSLSRSSYMVATAPMRHLVAWMSESPSHCEEWLLRYEPVAQDVIVPVGALQTAFVKERSSVRSVEVMRSLAGKTAAFDHFAAVVADKKLCQTLTSLCPHVDVGSFEPAAPVGGGVAEPSEAPPSYKTDDDALETLAIRRAAIREGMAEIQAENLATSHASRRAYADLTVRGRPNLLALQQKAELYRNPDLWLVRNGTIVQSALGLDVKDFRFSAVYSPLADPETDSNIRSVVKSVWEGVGPEGNKETHENFSLRDLNYCGWVLVNDDLVIHNGPEILSSMELALTLDHDYEVIVHRAPPGSGKTYQIVHTAKPDGTDAIMCPVRESINDTRSQFVKLHPEFGDAKLNIRTVDSYLVNFSRHLPTKELRVDRLLADECYMTMAAKWYAAAALLGVKEVHAYGDDKQIPHIPRALVSKVHVKLKAARSDDVWTTRRCPPSAVAAWGSVYGWKVRSLSTVDLPMRMVRDTSASAIPSGCVMMCMYQADKVLLRKKYAADLHRIRILTAHESEGKTYKHVKLHRFDLRKRTDKKSLFDQEPHVLVAMSRHTHTFEYVCGADLGDLPSQWIARSNDARRLAAAVDLESQGTSLEFL